MADAESPTSQQIALGDHIALGPTFVPERSAADFARAFAREINELFRRRLRVCASILLVFHGVAFVVFKDPAGSRAGLALRIAIVPLTASILAATWLRGLGASLRWLSAVLIVIMAAYAAWVNVTAADPYDVRALILCVVAGGLLFPFTTSGMLGVSSCVVASYFGAALATGHADAGALAAAAFFLVGASAVATVSASLSSRLREREHRARFELERANAQTEALVRNMLPAPIVERLKNARGSVADRHAEATVMFLDIVGFTTMSSSMPPEQVVHFLNDLFSKLDSMTTKHGLEKIKTIGDAYMVAGGLPEPRPDHAEAVASLAIEIRALVKGLSTPDGKKLDVRIGIHTGPVIAGVIGATKFTYDLWGDTVNTASRMESHSEPGMIQVTEATFAILDGAFLLEARGTLPIKGKGPMNVYALIDRKEAASSG